MLRDGESTLLDALAKAYPGHEVLPFATPPGRSELVLDGVFAVRIEEPVPHWLLVTRGMTELREKIAADPERSGYGYELTCRVPAGSPAYDFGWAIDWLASLADYVASTGSPLGPGHHLQVQDPRTDDDVCAVAFLPDIALATTRSTNGEVAFLQMVGLTHAEYEAARAWSTASLLDLVRERDPLLLTDAARKNHLADPAFAAAVAAGQQRDGSSLGIWHGGGLLWLVRDERLSVHLDLRLVDAFLRALSDRLAHGRSMLFAGAPRRAADGREPAYAHQIVVGLRPGTARWQLEQADGVQAATVYLSVDAQRDLAAALRPTPGEYVVPSLSGVRFVVVEPERIADWRYPW